LYNAYRQAGRADDGARELKLFQAIKERTKGAAIAEDMEWSFYSEIYETIEPKPADQKPAELKFRDVAVQAKLDPRGAGIAALYLNKQGKFQKQAVPLPAGHYEKAVWIDYDHDYDLDLVLLGEQSKLLRNNGAAGFSDQTADFPFVKGHALSGVTFELIADTGGVDLVVSYEDRAGVLYRDKLAAKYEAVPLDGLPDGDDAILAYDIDRDGWIDLAASGLRGTTLLYNREGKITAATTLERAKGPLAFVDLENRGVGDLVAGGVVYRNQG